MRRERERARERCGGKKKRKRKIQRAREREVLKFLYLELSSCPVFLRYSRISRSSTNYIDKLGLIQVRRISSIAFYGIQKMGVFFT